MSPHTFGKIGLNAATLTALRQKGPPTAWVASRILQGGVTKTVKVPSRGVPGSVSERSPPHHPRDSRSRRAPCLPPCRVAPRALTLRHFLLTCRDTGASVGDPWGADSTRSGQGTAATGQAGDARESISRKRLTRGLTRRPPEQLERQNRGKLSQNPRTWRRC